MSRAIHKRRHKHGEHKAEASVGVWSGASIRDAVNRTHPHFGILLGGPPSAVELKAVALRVTSR